MSGNLDRPTQALLSDVQLSYAGNDTKSLIALGGELERRGLYDRAWKALADAPVLADGTYYPEWNGGRLTEGALVVRKRMRHLGAELRMARFVVSARQNVPRLILSTDDRLVALFARTFPEVEVVNPDQFFQIHGQVYEASYERLAQYFGSDERAIRQSWRPLKAAHSALSEEKSAPVRIGIAWHSTNIRKPLPSLEDWSRFLSHKHFQFVSLQYREHEAGIDEIGQAAWRPILSAWPIDQITDVDGFASQVASLDGVLTISNTTAHMAGALGVPCIVMLDDLQHLTWPRDSNVSPFYPYLAIMRQEGRDWLTVMELAFSNLIHMIGKK